MADSNDIYELKSQLISCLLSLGMAEDKVAEISNDDFVRNLMLLERHEPEDNRLVAILNEMIEERKNEARLVEKQKKKD